MQETMHAQFDDIRSSWNDFNRLPNQRVCAANVGRLIRPLIVNGGVRVLDLACGTGHYSRICLDYGAVEVVGVDASRTMLGAAVAVSKAENYAVGTKLKFRLGDCIEPRSWAGGNFDLVLGIGLLDFAKDQTQVTNMLRTVEMNLKPGGLFVANQVRRSKEPATAIATFDDGYVQRFGQSASVQEQLEHGIRVRIAAHVSPDPIEFECYVLDPDILPKAIVAAHLDINTLEFPRIKVPDQLKEEYPPDVFGKDYESDKTSFSIVTVEKPMPRGEANSSIPRNNHSLSAASFTANRRESQHLNQKVWSHLVFGLLES